MKALQEFQSKYQSDFSAYLEKFVNSLYSDDYRELGDIFRYHLGLGDDRKSQGKRLRPFLTLLCCEGAGGNWHEALPAAAAIELIHNFSLIHDDIEDNGLMRRGKIAVWKKWGLAQGLNAGDAMFVAAFDVLSKLDDKEDNQLKINAYDLLIKTCLELTKGQYLDIDFENRSQVSVGEYMLMIGGKTASLLACCTKMGALIGGLPTDDQENYFGYGRSLGMAFQIYDDWLGVWGDSLLTGKSTTGDIIERKKTLPIILGISESNRFVKGMQLPEISPEKAEKMANWLREDGIEKKVIAEYRKWTTEANLHIEKMNCDTVVKQVLKDFTNKLLIRKT